MKFCLTDSYLYYTIVVKKLAVQLRNLRLRFDFGILSADVRLKPLPRGGTFFNSINYGGVICFNRY